MKLKIKKTYEEEKELTPPLFWKEDDSSYPNYVGFLDEKTAVKFRMIADYATSTNGTPKDLSYSIQEAYEKYLPISEEEFLSAFDDCWEAQRLNPKQFTTNNVIDHEAHQDLKQAINY